MFKCKVNCSNRVFFLVIKAFTFLKQRNNINNINFWIIHTFVNINLIILTLEMFGFVHDTNEHN